MNNISSIVRNGAMPARPEKIAPPFAMKPAEAKSYACLVCKDRGFTRRDVPWGHPDFGKPIPCQCKSVEGARRAMEKTYAWLGMGLKQVHELESMTFSSFQPQANGKAVALAYRKAHLYSDTLRGQIEDAKNCVLTGPYGVGKTHLACAILNDQRKIGTSCLFVSGNELFQAIYNRDFDENILKQAINVPLLCFDDLDKMQVKDDGSYQKTTLFTLFNQRYLAHRPVIITTNEEDDLHKWLHGSVLSRLLGNAENISVIGKDYRMAG